MIARIRAISSLSRALYGLATISPRPGFWAVFAAAAVSFIGIAMTTPVPAHAQLDTLLNPLAAIQSEAQGWVSAAQSTAQGIFRTLFIIEITFLGIQMALFRDNIGEFFGSVALKILTAGFFLWLIQDGPTIFNDIISSFTQIASNMDGNAGSSGLLQLIGEIAGSLAALALANAAGKTESLAADALSSPFVLGTGDASLANLPNNNLQDLFVVQAVEFFLVICVAVIVLQWILINIESSLVMGAGLLFLGFAGSKFTMPFAQGYLSYAFNVGVKLFTLYLILAVEANLGKSVLLTSIGAAAAIGADITGIGGAAGVLILYYTCAITMIMAILAWYIPNLAGSFLSGQSSMNASTVMSSMMGVMTGLNAFNANKAAAANDGQQAGALQGRVDSMEAGQGGSPGGSPGGMAGVGDAPSSAASVDPKGIVSSVGGSANGASSPSATSGGSPISTGGNMYNVGGSSLAGSNSASNFGSGGYSGGSSNGAPSSGGSTSAMPSLTSTQPTNIDPDVSPSATETPELVGAQSMSGGGSPIAGGSLTSNATPSSATGGGMRGGSPGVTTGASSGGGGGGYPSAPPLVGVGGGGGASPLSSPGVNAGGAGLGAGGGGGSTPADLQAQIDNYEAAEQLQNANALSSLRLPTADPVPSAVSVRLGMPDKL